MLGLNRIQLRQHWTGSSKEKSRMIYRKGSLSIQAELTKVDGKPHGGATLTFGNSRVVVEPPRTQPDEVDAAQKTGRIEVVSIRPTVRQRVERKPPGTNQRSPLPLRSKPLLPRNSRNANHSRDAGKPWRRWWEAWQRAGAGVWLDSDQMVLAAGHTGEPLGGTSRNTGRFQAHLLAGQSPEAGLYGAVRFTTFPSGKLHKLPGKDLCIRLYLDTCGVVDDDLMEVAPNLDNCEMADALSQRDFRQGAQAPGWTPMRSNGCHWLVYNSKVTESREWRSLPMFRGSRDSAPIGMTKVTDKWICKVAGLETALVVGTSAGKPGSRTAVSTHSLPGHEVYTALWLSEGISEAGRDRLRKRPPGRRDHSSLRI